MIGLGNVRVCWFCPEAIVLASLGILGNKENLRESRMSKRDAGRDKINAHGMTDEK